MISLSFKAEFWIIDENMEKMALRSRFSLKKARILMISFNKGVFRNSGLFSRTFMRFSSSFRVEIVYLLCLF